jgi:hypothetical protein
VWELLQSSKWWTRSSVEGIGGGGGRSEASVTAWPEITVAGTNGRSRGKIGEGMVP